MSALESEKISPQDLEDKFVELFNKFEDRLDAFFISELDRRVDILVRDFRSTDLDHVDAVFVTSDDTVTSLVTSYITALFDKFR